MALTDIEVRKARTRGGAYRISDGSGLFLWVAPAGGKLWRWTYRFDVSDHLKTYFSEHLPAWFASPFVA